MGRFGAFLAPSTGLKAAESGSAHLEVILSITAVAVALLGWLVADRFYRQRPGRAAQMAANNPGSYELVLNKYYVDELYGYTVVKPLLGFSKYLLGWFVDTALLGGGAWLLGGTATFAGALLQRWQSGNLRSYAAWLAAGAAAILLFIVVPWSTVWPASLNLIWKMAGH